MKQKLKTGDEWDWIAWRKVLSFRPGIGKKIKRALNKRSREDGKREADEHRDFIW